MARRSGAVLFAAALLCAAYAPAGARAATAASQADIHCYIVATIAINSTKEDKIRTAGIGAIGYYVGRIEGREPTLDLQLAFSREMARIDQFDLQAEARRCSAALAQLTKTTSDINLTMQRQARAANPRK